MDTMELGAIGGRVGGPDDSSAFAGLTLVI
jgi:hypothetical protein